MLRRTTLLLTARWMANAFTSVPARPAALMRAPQSSSFSSTLTKTWTTTTSTTTTTQLHLFGSRSGDKAKSSSTLATDEIRALFYLWNDALATGNSKIVAKRYAKDGPVLLPIVSDKPRTDYNSIKDYFDVFLLKKPQGTILEGYTKAGDGWAQDHGIYEFVMGNDGSKVKARYSFVYVKEGNEWKIQHHHSSFMPESMAVAQPITVNQVKNLFYLWNDALATLDPQVVTDRFAKNAVLLPTVSDLPGTNPTLIKNYFTAFLKLKPQGTILESNVRIGTNWCQDAGIYEFKLGGKNNEMVKARYTFVYVYEDGQWKIAHQHSSQMPEEIAAKLATAAGSSGVTISKPEVRKLFDLWNNALATGNPKTVAARYSKDAIVLPTISDTPRKTKSEIEDYFAVFLKLKPQGVITDGVVTNGPNWANDAGVYEFTMGADGSKVLARYSFTYVYEDGEWKIANQHSSAMPEGLMAASARVKELEKKGVKA